MMLRWIIGFTTGLLLFQAYAATQPVTCDLFPLTVRDNNLILNSAGQKISGPIYFIKNNYSQSLWIDHPNEKRSANAGWSSYIRPGQWSALMLNRKDFALSCAVLHPGQIEYLDCKKVLTVCLLQHYPITFLVKGTFWIAEDKNWEDLWKVVVRRTKSEPRS